MHRPGSSKAPRGVQLFVTVLIVACVVLLASLLWCISSPRRLPGSPASDHGQHQHPADEGVAPPRAVVHHPVHHEHDRDDDHHDNTPQPQPQPRPHPNALRYRIVVFTYLRPTGLQRLLRSLQNAIYTEGVTVALSILIDYPKDKKHLKNSEDRAARDTTLEMARTLRWPHGPLTVHRRQVNVGLKRNILESWYPPADDNEVAVLLEDDIEVSPFWFVWAQAATARYHRPQDESDDDATTSLQSRVLGVSLFRPIHDELSHRKCTVDNGHRPFLLQQPCSWGAVFFPRPWRAFRDFYDAYDETGDDPRVLTDRGEEPDSNTWPKASSWKKYLIRFMYERGWAMVYPNLPDKRVFSTNHLMKGEHPTPRRDLFELPLLDVDAAKTLWPRHSSAWWSKFLLPSTKLGGAVVSDDMQLFDDADLPPLEQLKSFDVMFNPVGSAKELLKPRKNVFGGGGGGGGGVHQHHHAKHHHHH